MTDLSEPWASYARMQKALSDTTSFSDKSEGLEAALNKQLDAISADKPATSEQASRWAASGVRRARHRKQLLKKFAHSLWHENADMDSAYDARRALLILANRTSRFDLLLLTACANGVGQSELADQTRLSPACVRQRVSRLRREHRALLN